MYTLLDIFVTESLFIYIYLYWWTAFYVIFRMSVFYYLLSKGGYVFGSVG